MRSFKLTYFFVFLEGHHEAEVNLVLLLVLVNLLLANLVVLD